MTDKDIYETLADLMGNSICAGSIPRDVVMRELKKRTPEELLNTIETALHVAAQLEAEGKAIGYDVEELRRVREIQRNMK